MGTFGNLNTPSLTVGVNNSWTYCLTNAGSFYTATGNETVVSLHVYISSQVNGDEMAMALYDVIAGVPTNKIMESSRFPVNTTTAWYQVAVNVPLSAGTTYTVAGGEFDAGNWQFGWSDNTTGSEEAVGANFPDPWGDQPDITQYLLMYATYTISVGQNRTLHTKIIY